MVRKYGVFTAIAMIVGIVIGSGIFFKSDNVLLATGGNVWLGVLMFCLAATGIIFGALAIAELAKRSEKAGGIVAYAEQFYSRKLACGYGWFQTLMYYPALQAVVSWVVGVYMCMLFPVPNTLEYQILIGVGVLVVLYAVNILAPKIAGFLQISATVIKIIPLIFLAVAGLILGEGPLVVTGEMAETAASVSWIAAIAPVAFAFDGWIAATSISKELKNEKRDLTLALIIAPIFILILYLIYFVGITNFVGADRIIQLGDEHVYVAVESLFGTLGARAVIVFVLISVLGTCNGLVLSHTRMPYALAENDMIFWGKLFRHRNKRIDTPLNSAIFAFMLAMLWMIIHYLTKKFHITKNSDISEISIVAQYAMYILLYYQVFKLWRKKEIKGIWKGILVPIFATFGAVFTFIGGFANPLFLLNIAIVLAVMAGAYIYESKHKKTVNITHGEIEPMFSVSPMDNIDIALDIIESPSESEETERKENDEAEK